MLGTTADDSYDGCPKFQTFSAPPGLPEGYLVLFLFGVVMGSSNLIFDKETNVMKRIVSILFVSILLGCSQPQESTQMSEVKGRSEQLPAAVQVCINYGEYETDHGSGFFVEKNGVLYLVTAKHVLKHIHEGKLYIKDGDEIVDLKRRGKGIIVSTSENCDYAFVPILSSSKKPHILKVGTVAQGDRISIMGYPGKVHEDKTVSFNLEIEKGTVQSVTIHTNAIAKRGHSGGAVINSNGEVVGVLSSISQDDNGQPVGSNVESIEGIYGELR
jgi:S1-C subfamily serine protease